MKAIWIKRVENINAGNSGCIWHAACRLENRDISAIKMQTVTSNGYISV